MQLPRSVCTAHPQMSHMRNASERRGSCREMETFSCTFIVTTLVFYFSFILSLFLLSLCSPVCSLLCSFFLSLLVQPAYLNWAGPDVLTGRGRGLACFQSITFWNLEIQVGPVSGRLYHTLEGGLSGTLDEIPISSWHSP